MSPADRGEAEEPWEIDLLRVVLGTFAWSHAGCGGSSPAEPTRRRAGRLPCGSPIRPSRRSRTSRPIRCCDSTSTPSCRSSRPGTAARSADDQAIKELWAAFTSTSTAPQPPAPRELPGSQPSAHRVLGLSDRRPGLLRLAHSPGPLGSRAGVPAVHPAARAVGRGAGPHARISPIPSRIPGRATPSRTATWSRPGAGETSGTAASRRRTSGRAWPWSRPSCG